mgnify:CR=1 FL=1
MSTMVTTVLLAGARFTERLPGPTIENPDEGSPGFEGFLATFLLAAAVIALAVLFTRQMRGAQARQRRREAEGTDPVAVAGLADGPAGTGGDADTSAHRTDDGTGTDGRSVPGGSA